MFYTTAPKVLNHVTEPVNITLYVKDVKLTKVGNSHHSTRLKHILVVLHRELTARKDAVERFTSWYGYTRFQFILRVESVIGEHTLRASRATLAGLLVIES